VVSARLKRLSEVFGSGFRLIQTRVEVTQHRMQQIVGIQFVTRWDAMNHLKTLALLVIGASSPDVSRSQQIVR